MSHEVTQEMWDKFKVFTDEYLEANRQDFICIHCGHSDRVKGATVTPAEKNYDPLLLAARSFVAAMNDKDSTGGDKAIRLAALEGTLTTLDAHQWDIMWGSDLSFCTKCDRPWNSESVDCPDHCGTDMDLDELPENAPERE